MYSKHLIFGPDDYLEFASRLTSNGEELLLSLRGKKNTEEITVSSLLLSKKEAQDIITSLQDWVDTLD